MSKDTATGSDDIHHQMLKHLPETALDTLLHIFNGIWTTGFFFSKSLRLATVILVPKPGKDHAEPTNYRPIALTSCLCKTLERLINKRLVLYLESNNLITKLQSGFRAERSTNETRLKTFIRDAFIKREHVVAVFFDLEKAYDTTWRYGILKDLHNWYERTDHEIFSAVILSLPLIQEGQLSVSGERMCTILVNRLED